MQNEGFTDVMTAGLVIARSVMLRKAGHLISKLINFCCANYKPYILIGTCKLNEGTSVVTFVFKQFKDAIHVTTQSLGPHGRGGVGMYYQLENGVGSQCTTSHR